MILRSIALDNETNTDVVITIPIDPYRVTISKIWCGYSATPTGGRITVAEYSAADELERVVFTLPIVTGGPHEFEFSNPPAGLPFDGKSKVVITLAAGGSGIRGDLIVMR